jgi:chromosome segregation ATPase
LNVSLDLSLPLKALGRPLQESIRELRRGYQSVSECLEQALTDCEQRGSELADCCRQLAEARQRLSECERQIADRARTEGNLSNRCATLEKRLEIKTAELSQANENVVHAQAECTHHQQRLELQAEQSDQLRARIARLEADYGEAREELGQLRGQFAPLAETASEAARLRGELDAARADIARLRDQAATPGDGAELQAQLTEVQAQRQQLQGELEAVRHRAAELTEALAEQQHASAAERDRWSEELRHLRQVMEQQSEAWSHRAAQASEDATALAATKERLIQAEAQIVQSKERQQVQVEQNEQLREEIKRIETHREAEREELGQLRGQIAPLAETANEAARLRGELAAAQAEIGRLRDQVANPAEGGELQQQLCAVQAERQQLQGELAALRERASNLDEMLAEQKRLAIAERDGWNEELRQVRQALDRQSEAWAERADQTAEDAQAMAAAKERALKAEAEIVQGKDRLQIQIERNQQLQDEIKHLEANREAARDELAQLRGQFGPLAENAAEAARLRGELSAAQVEIARLCEQVANPVEGAELQQQLCAIQAERQQLQGELEAARQRASDLGESLAEQQRSAAAERNAWSEELHRMREVLERQSEAWAERAGQPAEGDGTSAVELAAAEARVLEAETEIVRSKERLQIQNELNEQLRKQIHELEANRQAASGELAQLRGQFGPLAESAAQAAQLRAELDSANTELGRLTEQIAQAPDAAALEEQLAVAEVERQQLENELDLLRHRGAELVEQLAEQKRVAAAEREGWSEELRQLRRAVELQSKALAQRGGSPMPGAESIPETTPPHASPSNGAKPVDNVLGSVMEQFESLQRTKVRKLAKSER